MQLEAISFKFNINRNQLHQINKIGCKMHNPNGPENENQ